MTETRVFAIGTPPTFRQQVARALECSPEAIGWAPSVTAVEEILVTGEDAAHVLVLSPEVKEPDALGLADFVGRLSPTAAVILVRDRASTGLLPAAMRAGIRDVVDLSKGSHELHESLARTIEWSESLRLAAGDAQATAPATRGTVISVFSSKGGAGKSFLACNLAAAVAHKTGRETAIVDLDLRIGDVFSYYGTEPARRLDDLLAIGEKSDKDEILAVAKPLHDRVWGFGALPNPAADAVVGQVAGRVLRALRGAFPYTIVDGPADYSDQVLAAFDISDEICLIAGLDVVGLRHLSIALDTLAALGMPRERFRIILNRVDSKVGLTVADVERVLNLRVDATIPLSQAVPLSLNMGRPVFIQDPRSEVGLSIDAIADALLGTVERTIVEAPVHSAPAIGAKPSVLRLFGIG